MTVTTTLDRQYFPGDGSNKNFPFNFKFFDNSQIYVFLIAPDGSALGRTLNVDYTLSGALSPGGGQVTMVVAPPLNYRLFVQRILSPTQPTSIRNQGAFFPAIHEDVFDRLTMLIQQSLANDATSLQLDQSGTMWDFKGHRGINAADPVNAQDVVTKNWVGNYIDSISGLVNTTNGISYDAGTLFDYLRFGVQRSVDTYAAMLALSPSRNMRCKTLGYHAIGDGGGADYFYNGTAWQLIHNGTVNIRQFGAKGDGVTYDHVAVQAAVSTGLTVHIPRSAGMYRLGTAITCVTPGQLIYGDGKNVSFFLVDTTFTMASLGVFIGLTGEPGPQFKYFGVSFIQPETSVRANLTTYPAAFYVRGNPRVLMDGIKIMNASRGIDAQGNCGGSSFLNIDCSAYNYTMILDGSFDSVRIHGMHNWPFGMLAANQLIFKEAAAVGILSGRCDDLRISDSLFFCGTQLSTISTANGFTGGVCTGVCFDTNPRVSIGAGIMQFANCTFSTGIATANAISVTGAGTRVQMTGCSYLCAVALGGPLVSVVGSPNTSISIVGGRFDTGNFDVPSFAISSANAVMSGCTFDRAAGTAYLQPTVAINAGGRLSASGNRATDKGAGAGVFMAFTADDYHNIVGNTSPGWTYVKPTFTTGVFANNN